jgi:tetratricopeptide (TPR) repeat protein
MSEAGGLRAISNEGVQITFTQPLTDPRTNLPELAADLQAALAHHREGKLEEAEELYRKVLNAAPNQPQATRLLGVIETQRGRPEHGVELIGRAFPALAQLPEAHVDLGHALRLAGKREEAAESYRRAVALKPDSALAHICLGSALGELGRFEAAISHCRTALAIDSDSVPARITLAAALQAARRLPESAQVWRELFDLEPERAQSYHQLAGQLVLLGLLNEALYCHERAIASQPDNADFHCARGNTLFRLYDGEAAAASFRRALALSPDCKEGWVGLSWALRMLGRFGEADACVERLREIDPTDLRAVRHVPSTGQQSQEATEIERLTAAVDRPDGGVEDRITAGFALGRLLDDSGRFDEAFLRYSDANALMRCNWPPYADRISAAAFTRAVDALIGATRKKTLPRPCPAPIFRSFRCSSSACLGRARHWSSRSVPAIRACSEPANWTAFPISSQLWRPTGATR